MPLRRFTPPENGKILAIYDYVGEHNRLLYQIVRFAPKIFRYRRSGESGEWIWDLDGVELILFHLPDVIKSETVLVLEGEKDVCTAYKLGLPDGWAATSCAMGAGQWRSRYSEILRGKRVIICPDTDVPGQRHLRQVSLDLVGKAADIRKLTLPNGVKDLTEWAESGGTSSQFTTLLDTSAIFDLPY